MAENPTMPLMAVVLRTRSYYGPLIAIFPTQLHLSPFTKRTMVTYYQMGLGFGQSEYEWLIRRTKPASAAEAETMLAELRLAGFRLKVCKRWRFKK